MGNSCMCKMSPQAKKKKGWKEIRSEGKEKQVNEESEEDDFHARPVRSVAGAAEENATLCVTARGV